jgi:hypothetical protein
MDSHQRFTWRSYDVASCLPSGWQSQLLCLAQEFSVLRTLLASGSITCREKNPADSVDVLTVGGLILKERVRWLWDMYHGEFLTLASDLVGEEVFAAKDDRYGVVLNVQRGNTMRYECHVDSNPLEGILFATEYTPDGGGELVFARSSSARGCHEIEENCELIRQRLGSLILFDGRHHPHYVRALKDSKAIRVVAAMNYYTADCTERERPTDLNRHLFGED